MINLTVNNSIWNNGYEEERGLLGVALNDEVTD